MKRKILILILGLMLGSILVGVLKRNAEPERQLEVLTQQVYSMDYGFSTFFDDILASYEQAYPDQRIHHQKFAPHQYNNLLNIKLLSGDRPDLFQFEKQWKATYEKSDKLMGDWQPLLESNYYLVCNMELMESAGFEADDMELTLEEVTHYAHIISENKKGFNIYGYGLPLDQAQRTFQENLFSPYSCYGYSLGDGDFDRYIPWFQAVRTLYGQDSMYPGSTSLTKEKVLHEFASGSIGMLVVSSLDLYLIEKYEPSFEWRIGPVPKLRVEDREVERVFNDFYLGISDIKDEDAKTLYYYVTSETNHSMIRDNQLKPAVEIMEVEKMIIDPVVEELFIQLLLEESELSFEETLIKLKDYYKELVKE